MVLLVNAPKSAAVPGEAGQALAKWLQAAIWLVARGNERNVCYHYEEYMVKFQKVVLYEAAMHCDVRDLCYKPDSPDPYWLLFPPRR